MDPIASNLNELRRHFDYSPYPIIPLEYSPKNNYNDLFFHDFTTAYYRAYRQVPKTDNLLILDAGCGSGWKMLHLAEANPGARIVGVDLSEASIEVAQKRLTYHQIQNVELHVMPIEEITTLGHQFDYINCDETLYYVSDPVQVLRCFRAVLKPQGLIRANLHSLYQRQVFYRLQEAFQILGLKNQDTPVELELDVVISVLSELRDETLKEHFLFTDEAQKQQQIVVNLLPIGDKGYTIESLFAMLNAADLEFVSMLNWDEWDLRQLFKNPLELPAILEMGLPEASQQEQLQLFELLNPTHRLLDFWCGLSGQPCDRPQIEAWTDEEWLQAKVHLHPQLLKPSTLQAIDHSLAQYSNFLLSNCLRGAARNHNFIINPIFTSCFKFLATGSHDFQSLLEYWKRLYPVNPLTLEPISDQAAILLLKEFLLQFETFGYILL
jgi:SAM-dependent methyltransferase